MSIEILLFVIVIITFIIGLLGIVLPVIPSLPIIWCGIVVFGLFTDFQDVTIVIVVITFILMLLGTVFDVAASVFGAKVYGASWWGVAGALIGSVVGLIILNVLGLIIGSFVGAFIFEYMRYKKTHPAIRAGFGTIVGFVFGVVTKIFISFLMIGIFIYALF